MVVVVCEPSVDVDVVVVADGVVVVDDPAGADEEVDDDPVPELVPLVDELDGLEVPLEVVDDELP